MSIKNDQAKLRATKMVHHEWYQETYPDVFALKMASTEHYLRYGAAMGRNPNAKFDTKYYLSQAEKAGPVLENPILHYVARMNGPDRIEFPDFEKEMKAQLADLRHKLLTLGLTEPAIAELRDLSRTSPLPLGRALALRQIALWYMDGRTPEGLTAALVELAAARVETDHIETLSELTATEMMCHYLLGDVARARAVYEAAALRGEINSDAMLIRANLEQEVPVREAIINVVLERHDITPISFLPNHLHEPELSLYDRLTSAIQLPEVTEGPLVTVLIASYNADKTIKTALRSLREQTWRNLQIIVIDDCSPNPRSCAVVEECARLDPRIELVRMEKNGGAYIARNRGLDLARGKYVTLHDADDWSHPHKIEFQVKYMEDHPGIMGSTTQQARSTADMMFNRWSGAMHCLKINMSSLMFRREEMREKLGYWDTVRFGADSELLVRMKAVFGKSCIATLKTGPLSFQRDSDSSIVADDILGMRGFYFGVRKEYHDAQVAHHARAAHLKYDNNVKKRPFPVPRAMRPDRDNLPVKPHFDVIIASDFRMGGGSVKSCLEEIRASVAAGLRIGLIWMFRYDQGGRKIFTALPEVRSLIDGEQVKSVVFGEEASCDLLIIRYPPVLQHMQRYLPRIEAGEIKVIVNQPPVSDYGPDGVLRYRLADCARNLRQMFGKDASWHPIGPKIREALLTQHADELSEIHLSDEDWVNIIDVSSWSRGEYLPHPDRPIRIGRHSRDNAMKWPDNPETVAKVYPTSRRFEVHILGGINSIRHLVPVTPPNWTVHKFDALQARDFLAGLDVFVYFHNSNWVESFGRTIFEAMAVGVPVILPPDYRTVFGEAALYATPDQVQTMVMQLCSDPACYAAQVDKARAYVAVHYGYQMHSDRLEKVRAGKAD